MKPDSEYYIPLESDQHAGNEEFDPFAGPEMEKIIDEAYAAIEFDAWMQQESEITEAIHQMETIEVATIDWDAPDDDIEDEE